VFKSLDEYIKYGDLPPDLRGLLESHLDDVAETKAELKRLERGNEILQEQVENARANFEALEAQLGQVTSAKQARAAFTHVMENGYFEM